MKPILPLAPAAPLTPKSPILHYAHLMREVALFVRGMFRGPRLSRPARPSRWRGPRILVLPGLMANDASMRPLRLRLRAQGLRAFRWCMGRNLGVTPDLLDRLDARVRRLQRKDGRPIVLVGWSLGGLIAREYAKRSPQRVAAVVTLGSPFSGEIANSLIARVYRWVAGHPVSAVPIPCNLAEKPPVPTAAIWSRCDGVIPAAAARGDCGEADFEIEVACPHLGYPSDAAAADAVIAAIRRCRVSEALPVQARTTLTPVTPARAQALRVSTTSRAVRTSAA